jgi:hypothetical protein
MTAIGDLLTDEERQALYHLSQAANLLRAITMPGEYPGDWAEAAAALHVLQRMIISQVAVRLFPEEFRPLGGRH